ncbi:MAG: alpha/beta fold hydrolase, partial [Acidobacteriota bacterium]
MSRTSPRPGRGATSRTSRGLKVLLGLMAALLVVLVLNAIALNNETEPASVPAEGMRLVETTSGPLQVLDTGPVADPDAIPIVLVHGTGGAINWWDEVIPLLAAEHRVVAIDMLGYGGSSKPESDYSVETQAGLISQVLARLGIDRAAVAGHSLGGDVVTALAVNSPDLVEGVILIDAAPDTSFGGLSGSAKAIKIPLFGQALWRLTPDSLIRKNLEQAFVPGFDVPDKFVDDVRAMTFPAYRKSLDSSGDFTDGDPLNEQLAKTGGPLLVIFGEEDEFFPARETISAFATVPGVETLLLPGVGHSPQVEVPERTAAAIGRFTAGLTPPEGPSTTTGAD